jgi:alpha-1,3-glucosyltransferase
MMYGIMLLSIAYIIEKKYYKSALLFAILLNFKHIFLYFAPCFGLYYIKKAVISKKNDFKKGTANFIMLAL